MSATSLAVEGVGYGILSFALLGIYAEPEASGDAYQPWASVVLYPFSPSLVVGLVERHGTQVAPSQDETGTALLVEASNPEVGLLLGSTGLSTLSAYQSAGILIPQVSDSGANTQLAPEAGVTSVQLTVQDE